MPHASRCRVSCSIPIPVYTIGLVDAETCLAHANEWTCQSVPHHDSVLLVPSPFSPPTIRSAQANAHYW